MRIIYISFSTIPSRTANSIQVIKMCQAFAKIGHEVLLFAPNRKHDLEFGVKDIYGYYGVENCFEIVKIPWINIYKIGSIYGFLAAFLAKRNKPNLVYSRNTVSCYIAAKLGLPVVFESHAPSTDSGNFSDFIFGRLIRSPRLRKIVVISQALKDYYETNYIPCKNKIHVAPDGADPVPIGICPVELPNSGKRLQVGYLGHLYKGRGIEIIYELSKLCEWADFHVVGGNEKDIAYWRQKCSHQKNMIFHGFVPPVMAERIRVSCDILLSPYQFEIAVGGDRNINTSKWMSPLKIFEYMAAGKPIISSDLPVLNEILKDKHNSLLCHPLDVHAWKNALSQLRIDSVLRSKIANNAFKEFQMHYTWSARANLILASAF